MLGALSTMKCCNHLVVDINVNAMLPRGAAVVGTMVWTKELSSMTRDKNLGLVLRFLVGV